MTWDEMEYPNLKMTLFYKIIVKKVKIPMFFKETGLKNSKPTLHFILLSKW